MYAVETTLSKEKSIRYLNNYLQHHINKLYEYFNKWRIKVIPRRLQVRFLGKKDLYIDGKDTEFSKEIKYLGMYLDSKLT